MYLFKKKLKFIKLKQQQDITPLLILCPILVKISPLPRSHEIHQFPGPNARESVYVKRESLVINAFEEKIAASFPRAACQRFSRSFFPPMSFKETSPERGRGPQEDIASHISRGPHLSLISLQSPVPSHKYAKKLHPFFTAAVSVTPAMSTITQITALSCKGDNQIKWGMFIYYININGLQ